MSWADGPIKLSADSRTTTAFQAVVVQVLRVGDLRDATDQDDLESESGRSLFETSRGRFARDWISSEASMGERLIVHGEPKVMPLVSSE